MRDATEAAYAPPRHADEAPAPAPGPASLAARVAGAFIAVVAVLRFGGWLLASIPETIALLDGDRALRARHTYVVAVVQLVIDAGLALPLLRGSRRFRWLAVGRAWLLPALVFAATLVTLRPDGALAATLSPWAQAVWLRDGLYVAAVTVLLLGHPGRVRLAVGLGCIVGFAVLSHGLGWLF